MNRSQLRAVFGVAAVLALLAIVFVATRTKQRNAEASQSRPAAVTTPTSGDGAQQPPNSSSLRDLVRQRAAGQTVQAGHTSAMAPADPRQLPFGELNEAQKSLPVVLPGLPDNELGRALTAFITAGFHIGPDAQAKLDAALAELRKHDTKEVVAALREAYKNMPENAYKDRQTALQAATMLESQESAELLIEAATEPMPAGLPPDGEGLSPLMEEGVIRYIAIDGLEALAKRGNTEADAALAELVATGHPTVQAHATLAYVSAGPNTVARQQVAAGLLPPERAFLAQRERVDGSQTQQEPPEQRPNKPGIRSGEPIAGVPKAKASADGGT